MVQVKKVGVQEAILESAFNLFQDQGYTNTTLSQIGRHSGVNVSNIYNYFNSKLDILSAIYGPWTDDQLTQLLHRVSAEASPRSKIKGLIRGLFLDIPEQDEGFAHLWLEAISSRRPEDHYSRAMLLNLEERVSQAIRKILPKEHGDRFTEQNLLAHLLFMAFDGFAINYHVVGKSKRAEKIANMLTDLIFASSGVIKR